MMIRAATSDVLPAGTIAALASCIFALGVVAGELPAPAGASGSAGASSTQGSVSDLLHHAESSAAAGRFEQLLGAINGAPAASKTAEKPAEIAAPAPAVTPAAPAARPAPRVAEVKADPSPPPPPAPAAAKASMPSPVGAAPSGLPTLVFPQTSAGKLPGKLSDKLQERAP